MSSVMMVNFTCQPNWATWWPDVWSHRTQSASVTAFPDEINVHMGKLRTAGGLPHVAGSLPSGRRRRRGRERRLPPWSGTSGLQNRGSVHFCHLSPSLRGSLRRPDGHTHVPALKQRDTRRLVPLLSHRRGVCRPQWFKAWTSGATGLCEEGGALPRRLGERQAGRGPWSLRLKETRLHMNLEKHGPGEAVGREQRARPVRPARVFMFIYR